LHLPNLAARASLQYWPQSFTHDNLMLVTSFAKWQTMILQNQKKKDTNDFNVKHCEKRTFSMQANP